MPGVPKGLPQSGPVNRHAHSLSVSAASPSTPLSSSFTMPLSPLASRSPLAVAAPLPVTPRSQSVVTSIPSLTIHRPARDGAAPTTLSELVEKVLLGRSTGGVVSLYSHYTGSSGGSGTSGSGSGSGGGAALGLGVGLVGLPGIGASTLSTVALSWLVDDFNAAIDVVASPSAVVYEPCIPRSAPFPRTLVSVRARELASTAFGTVLWTHACTRTYSTHNMHTHNITHTTHNTQHTQTQTHTYTLIRVALLHGCWSCLISHPGMGFAENHGHREHTSRPPVRPAVASGAAQGRNDARGWRGPSTRLVLVTGAPAATRCHRSRRCWRCRCCRRSGHQLVAWGPRAHLRDRQSQQSAAVAACNGAATAAVVADALHAYAADVVIGSVCGSSIQVRRCGAILALCVCVCLVCGSPCAVAGVVWL